MPASACLKCFKLIPVGATYCTAHTPRPKDSQRAPSHLRGFTHEYRKNRAITLQIDRVCILCGIGGANTADHIKPRAMGIDNSLTNLCPAHLSCNSRRQDKPYTDEQKRRVAIYMHLLDTYCELNGIPL